MADLLHFECVTYDFSRGNGSFRVAKQTNGGLDIRVILAEGAWTAVGNIADTSTVPIGGLDGPQPSYLIGDRTYFFGYWIVRQTGQPPLLKPTLELGEILWPGSATAFYFWDFGGGSGPNFVLVDAMATDGDDYEFIADDFVDVQLIPDRNTNEQLTHKANELGKLQTQPPEPDLVIGEKLKITARYAEQKLTDDPKFKFIKWIEVLRAAAGGEIKPPKDKVSYDPAFDVYPDDFIIRIAFFTRLTPKPKRPPRLHSDWHVIWGAIDDTPGVIVGPKGEIVPIPPFPPEPFSAKLIQQLQGYGLLRAGGLPEGGKLLQEVLLKVQQQIAKEHERNLPKKN
jgi:hypothetical protein